MNKFPHADTGYRPCACRDCMEIAIGDEGAFCLSCEAAGCSGDGECDAPEAYAACDAAFGPDDDAGIPATGEPHVAIEALLTRLAALDPAARERIMPAINGIPTAALTDPAHAYWDSTESVDVLTAIILATHRAKDAAG